MPVDASAHDPEDIYQRQQDAMKHARKRINNTNANGNNANAHNLNMNNMNLGPNPLTMGAGGAGAGGHSQAYSGHGHGHGHHVQGHSSAGLGGGGGARGVSGAGTGRRMIGLPTPGQTIGNTGNMAQIARDAMRDEELGGGGGTTGGSSMGMNMGGGYAQSNYQQQWQQQTQAQTHQTGGYGATNKGLSLNTQQQQQQQPQLGAYQRNSHDNGAVDSMHMQFLQQLPSPPYKHQIQNANKQSRFNSETTTISDSLNYSYPTIQGESDRMSAYNGMAVNSTAGKGAMVDQTTPVSPGDVDGDGGSERTSSSYSSFGEEPEDEKLTLFQYLIFHKEKPEFTSLQQLVWAVFIGIIMGIFTALWGELIEYCIDIVWVRIPEFLLEKGIFTDLDGRLPLPYYMVICPAIFGGVLSYGTAAMTNPKVPGQNEWIESLHRIGIMDHTMFFPVVIFSTLGMASGLSLGPEMPLVLSAGMVGSIVAVICKQSVLSARVMNLTAASAGIGGFFGLPMAGALFVLELPHRMGLQYFEAVSPATLASIVSVIVNRMITGDELNGMFKYPFLSQSLPSSIFWVVIIYGFVGCFVGTLYAEGLLWLKHWVHEWFHAPHDDHDHGDHGHHAKVEAHHHGVDEMMPLVVGNDSATKMKKESCCTWVQKGVQRFFGIEHEPTRAAVAGVLVGIIVGLNCMLLPVNLFWGEAQLQTMIDRGMTPLPVFSYGDEPTAILTAYGYCMIDPQDERARIEGFSTACAGVITITKIIIVGLSLGTGVCGGHFWAPLFVGCGASHFFTDLMSDLTAITGIGKDLSAYPCLAVLCIMGCSHVVTFRAQLAIVLVLTLTINSFTSGEKLHTVTGDYCAIFPLLVVSCFVPLLVTRNVTFYAKQCCRGDITAIPEVLCEPNKQGTAQIYRIDNMDDFTNSSAGSYGMDDDDDDNDLDEGLSVEDSDDESGISMESDKNDKGSSATTPRTEDTSLNSPDHDRATVNRNSLRSVSEPVNQQPRVSADPLSQSMHSIRSTRSNSSRRSRSSTTSRPNSVTRVRSVGKIDDSNYQKPLLYQGREGAASNKKKVPTGPKIPRSHRRSKSGASLGSSFSPPKGDDLGQSKH